MSGMIFGRYRTAGQYLPWLFLLIVNCSIVEADRRLIAHEQIVRAQKRLARDAEVWRRYEEEFEELGTPGVGAESKVSNQSQQK